MLMLSIPSSKIDFTSSETPETKLRKNAVSINTHWLRPLTSAAIAIIEWKATPNNQAEMPLSTSGLVRVASSAHYFSAWQIKTTKFLQV